jgi:HEAT repeat protein
VKNAKWMAIRILGNLRYERAVPLLLKSVSDLHHYVGANAARALGDMRVAAAAKPLTELLRTGTNGGVIQQTSLALANLPRFDAGDDTLAAAARLKCSFPHAGHYTVQVWFSQEQGSDVLKAELPFSVLTEGD